MVENSNISSSKINRIGLVKFFIGTGMTAALTFVLLSTAFAKPKTGVRTALDGAQNYSCMSVCYERYVACRNSGSEISLCNTRYANCAYNCAGATAAPQVAPQSVTNSLKQ